MFIAVRSPPCFQAPLGALCVWHAPSGMLVAVGRLPTPFDTPTASRKRSKIHPASHASRHEGLDVFNAPSLRTLLSKLNNYVIFFERKLLEALAHIRSYNDVLTKEIITIPIIVLIQGYLGPVKELVITANFACLSGIHTFRAPDDLAVNLDVGMIVTSPILLLIACDSD